MKNIRFTFFGRLFVSLLIVTLLTLLLLSLAFSFSAKKNIYQNKRSELISASRGIAKILQKESDPRPLLQAYRSVLVEQNIQVIVLSKNGLSLLRDQRFPMPKVNDRSLVASLQQSVKTMKHDHPFLIAKKTSNPLMIAPRTFKLKGTTKNAVVFVVSPIQGIQHSLRQIYLTLIYAALVALLLAVIVSWIISRSMSSSILSLRLATKQIADGDFTVRSKVSRSDELGQLSEDFNQMAAKLESAMRRLEQYEQRRRQFILDVSHELRTPLTSIRGIAEGLKSGLVEQADSAKYFNIIEKETLRLIRLINGLLDMEKVENGTVTLHLQNYPLRELLTLIVETLEVQISERTIKVRVDCPESMEIYGDYDRMTQIFMNLIKNSIQFTYHGMIQITAREDNDNTFVEIKDSGAGMTAEELEHIWERFYKTDPSRSKGNGETGLGLSIVKLIVQRHGGHIEAESTPGLGSVFRVRLPKPSKPAAPHANNSD